MVSAAAGTGMTRAMLWLLAGFAVATAAVVAFWSYYGTAVFFEAIRAGFVACF